MKCFSEILTWRFAGIHAVFASAVLCKKKNVPWWVTNSCVSVFHYSVIKHLQSTCWRVGLGVVWRVVWICGPKTCLALGHKPFNSQDPSPIFPPEEPSRKSEQLWSQRKVLPFPCQHCFIQDPSFQLHSHSLPCFLASFALFFKVILIYCYYFFDHDVQLIGS